MDSKLFFVNGDKAIEMNEHPYEAEDYLQKFVADNPNLLSRAWGDDEGSLYLIQRELGIAETEDGANSFSLDHILVSEDGVPVLVEVKRSSDTRIRREVVAQMFDYACRACTWDVDKLRAMFDANNSDETVENVSTDDFWAIVAANLKAERLRLVFVADKIPFSLRVLIEFFDRNFINIEVYGVEIRQYMTSDARLLSSSVVGNGLTAKQKSGSAGKRFFRTWNFDEFIGYIQQHGLGDVVCVMRELWDFTGNDLGLSRSFGHGKTPSYSCWMKKSSLFTVDCWWSSQRGNVCTVNFFLPYHISRLEESGVSEADLRALFTDIPRRQDAYDSGLIWETERYVYVNLHTLLEEDRFMAFKAILRKICDLSAGAKDGNFS